MGRLLENEWRLHEMTAEDAKRKYTEAANRAYGNAVGVIAAQLAASYVFHPDARIAGEGYAKWTGIAMMAPLVSAGLMKLDDLIPEGNGRG